mmetsp:Transcript_38748/g.109583  ORF Transcript_38748/g.109583 Transcript_38748/m.109583 type:complete len:247 (-) Transcript_38748:529-1269(-)
MHPQMIYPCLHRSIFGAVCLHSLRDPGDTSSSLSASESSEPEAAFSSSEVVSGYSSSVSSSLSLSSTCGAASQETSTSSAPCRGPPSVGGVPLAVHSSETAATAPEPSLGRVAAVCPSVRQLSSSFCFARTKLPVFTSSSTTLASKQEAVIATLGSDSGLSAMGSNRATGGEDACGDCTTWTSRDGDNVGSESVGLSGSAPQKLLSSSSSPACSSSSSVAAAVLTGACLMHAAASCEFERLGGSKR